MQLFLGMEIFLIVIMCALINIMYLDKFLQMQKMQIFLKYLNCILMCSLFEIMYLRKIFKVYNTEATYLYKFYITFLVTNLFKIF
jgi:hypothetical protein